MEGARRLIGSHRERSCCPAGAVLCYGTPLGLGGSIQHNFSGGHSHLCGCYFHAGVALARLRIAHTSVRTAHLFVEELNELPLWPWFAAIVVLSFATAYLIMMWDKIPSRFPFHWNHAGDPDKWAERTIWYVFRPLLIGIGAVTSIYGLQRFQRWFLRRQWSTFGQMMRARHLLGLRVITYSSTWVALGSAAVAVSLPFAAKLDVSIMVAAVVCYLGIPAAAALALRSTGRKQAGLE